MTDHDRHAELHEAALTDPAAGRELAAVHARLKGCPTYEPVRPRHNYTPFSYGSTLKGPTDD